MHNIRSHAGSKRLRIGMRNRNQKKNFCCWFAAGAAAVNRYLNFKLLYRRAGMGLAGGWGL